MNVTHNESNNQKYLKNERKFLFFFSVKDLKSYLVSFDCRETLAFYYGLIVIELVELTIINDFEQHWILRSGLWFRTRLRKGTMAPNFCWATSEWTSCIIDSFWQASALQSHIARSEPMSNIDQQGSSLGWFPTCPFSYPHFNRPSGYWSCDESCLVGDIGK